MQWFERKGMAVVEKVLIRVNKVLQDYRITGKKGLMIRVKKDCCELRVD